MNFTAIVAGIKAVMEAVELAQRAGKSVAPYIDRIARIAKGDLLTAEESAQLVIDRKALSATLQEPLPPEVA